MKCVFTYNLKRWPVVIIVIVTIAIITASSTIAVVFFAAYMVIATIWQSVASLLEN